MIIKNGRELAGKTEANLVIPKVRPFDYGDYKVVVTNDFDNSLKTESDVWSLRVSVRFRFTLNLDGFSKTLLIEASSNGKVLGDFVVNKDNNLISFEIDTSDLKNYGIKLVVKESR